MEDPLRDWLELRFRAAEQQDDPSGDGPMVSDGEFDGVANELLESMDRAGECADLLRRVWAGGDQDLVNFEATASQRCGRFEIREPIGSGGMGTVFRAFDPLLNRDVALKIPHPGMLLSPEAIRRFERESQTAARLSHPNLIGVLECGIADGVRYIALEYCPGPTLSQWLDSHAAPLSIRVALEITLQLADAIQHAHDRGVVHRDLKPSNVVMDGAVASCTPRITDFGLARFLEGDAVVTRSQATIGTAEYMAPEQVQAQSHLAGPACDQFALGVILYQLLTGHNPFRRDSFELSLAAVATCEPVRPCRLRPEVSRDLEAVCLKSLRKLPSQRYPSVREFAQDLQRVLDGRETLARPVGRIELTRRWILRHPAFTCALLTVVLSLIVTTAVSWQAATRSRQLLERTEQLLYASDVKLAAQSLQNANARQARELLARHLPSAHLPPTVDRRTFAWHYLWAVMHRESQIVRMPSGLPAEHGAVLPDGERLLTGHADGQLRLWDRAMGNLLQTVRMHHAGIDQLVVNEGSAYTLDETGELAVWAIGTVSPPNTDRGQDAGEYSLGVIAPTGRFVVLATRDGQLWLRSRSAPDTLELLGRHRDVRAAAFTSDETEVITVGAASSVKRWSLNARALVRDDFPRAGELPPGVDQQRLDAVAVSADNRWIAVGSNLGNIIVFERESGRELASLTGHTSNIYDLEFLPDGDLLSASKDSTIRIWDPRSARVREILQGHERPVYEVAKDPRGVVFASAGKDETVRIWQKVDGLFETWEDPDLLAWEGTLLDATEDFVGTGFGAVFCARQDTGQQGIRQQGTGQLTVAPFLLPSTRGLSAVQNGLVAIATETLCFDGDLQQAEASHVRAFDLDGDGDLDRIGGFGGDPALVIFEENRSGDGDADYAPPRLWMPRDDYRWFNCRRRVEWNIEAPVSLIVCNPEYALFHMADVHASSSPPRLSPGKEIMGLAAPTAVWPCDMDQDGDQDLVVAESQADGVSWLETDESRSFTKRHLLAPSTSGVYGVLAVDLTGTGQPYTFALDETGRLMQLTGAAVRGRVATDHQSVVLAEQLPIPSALDARDVDNDGRVDLLCASREKILWWKQSEAGELQRQTSPITRLDEGWTRPLGVNCVVWDARTNRVLTQWHTGCLQNTALAFSPDAQRIVTASQGANVLRFWNAKSGDLIRQAHVQLEANSIQAMAFTRDGRHLLLAAGDHAYVWQDHPAGPLRKLVGHDNTVDSVIASPDGRWIVTTSHDYSIRVWDLLTGKVRFTLSGHRQQPRRACFSPDLRTLATGGDQGEIVLWDMTTGQALLVLDGFSCGRLIDVAFPDDTTLIAVGRTIVDGQLTTRWGKWKTRKGSLRTAMAR